MKVPYIIYADLECLLKKMSPYHNNPDTFYTEKNIYASTFWLFNVYTLFI